MEKKGEIKISLGSAISIIIIFIILILSGIILYKNNAKITLLEEKIANQKLQIEKEIEEPKNESVDKNIITNSDNVKISNGLVNDELNKLVIPSLFTSNAKKLTSVNDVEYSINIADSSDFFIIKIEQGIASVYTTLKEEQVKNYGIDVSEININQTYKKISGFNKKVVDACIIGDEHQVAGTTFVFLMEDGTIEYSNIKNLMEKVCSQGKIDKLENIIRLQKVRLSNSHWSDSSAIAIDKNNNYYDVMEYLN